jgi:hypothetical protein
MVIPWNFGQNIPMEAYYNGVPTTIWLDVIPRMVIYINQGEEKPLNEISPPPGYLWKNPEQKIPWNYGEERPTDAIYNGKDAVVILTVRPVSLPTSSPTIPPLIKDDHFQYMHGYPEGDFRQEGSMTRAEAAVMFARLMVKNMNVDYPYKATFSDVKITDWFYREVEFLASYEIINGYPQKGGGQYFNPSAPITRAEFAKISAKYDELTLNSGSSTFPDVPASHWAYNYISSAARRQWVKGYDDGLFRPNNNIRRVEVVTIVNRMLERVFDPIFGTNNYDQLLHYTDLSRNYWGYADIMEASNGHDHYYDNSGNERWIKVRGY